MSDLMVHPVIARIATEYFYFGAAGLITVVAFATLILAPALGSFSRGWEKFAAGLLSLFVLAALILVGLVIGFVVFYNWDSISG
jgi:hypothetical protein